MTFYINAWLDRADPFISLRNKLTGEEVTRFEKAELQECLDQGDFCLHELCSVNPLVQQELVKCLLLTRCSNDLRCQLNQCLEECLSGDQPNATADILPFRPKRSLFVAQARPQYA